MGRAGGLPNGVRASLARATPPEGSPCLSPGGKSGLLGSKVPLQGWDARCSVPMGGGLPHPKPFPSLPTPPNAPPGISLFPSVFLSFSRWTRRKPREGLGLHPCRGSAGHGENNLGSGLCSPACSSHGLGLCLGKSLSCSKPQLVLL